MTDEVNWKLINQMLSPTQAAAQLTTLMDYKEQLVGVHGDATLCSLDSSRFKTEACGDNLPTYVKNATEKVQAQLSGRSTVAKPLRMNIPRLTRKEDLVSFRLELGAYFNNEYGQESHCLDKVGRPNPLEKGKTFEYTRAKGTDATDNAIATALCTSLSKGEGKVYLVPKLVAAGKGHEIFSNMVKAFEGLNTKKIPSLKIDFNDVRHREGEHYSVCFSEMEKLRDELSDAGEVLSEYELSLQVEIAFAHHKLFGKLVDAQHAGALSFEEYKVKFEDVRSRYNTMQRHAGAKVASYKGGMRGGAKGSGGWRSSKGAGGGKGYGGGKGAGGGKGYGGGGKGYGGGGKGAGGGKGYGGGGKGYSSDSKGAWRGTGKGTSKGAGKGGKGYGRAYLTDTECYIATGETVVGNYIGDPAPEQEYSVESGTDVSAYIAEDESEWYDPENEDAEAESAWYAENDAQPHWHEEYASLMVSDNAVVKTNDAGSFVSVDITRSADKEVGDADAVSVKEHSITMGVLTMANDPDLKCPWYDSVQSAFVANTDEEGFMQGTMDSGCTTSLTNNVEMLTNLRPCDIKIKLGDSRYTTATQRGDIAMVMKDATGAEEHFMHPALFVKECPVTLLSVNAFTKQGYDFHFGRNHACMTEEKARPGMKSRLFPLKSNGRLWELRFKLQGTTSNPQ
jgi:hypothetical protein